MATKQGGRKGNRDPKEVMLECYRGMVAVTRAIAFGKAPLGIVSDCYNAVVNESTRALQELGGTWEHPDGMSAKTYRNKNGKNGITWHGKEMTAFVNAMDSVPGVSERYAQISELYYDKLGAMIGIPVRKIGGG